MCAMHWDLIGRKFAALMKMKRVSFQLTPPVASRLDDDEKNTLHLTQGTSGNPNATIINEPGLYSLVLGSRKPEAKAFKHWITHDVIPSIRKHGGREQERHRERDAISELNGMKNDLWCTKQCTNPAVPAKKSKTKPLANR